MKKTTSYISAESELFNSYQLARKEHFIKIEKYGIRVRVQTIGEGIPVLFIHGGPNAGSTWAQLVSLLPGYKCILLDRPGCGLSEAVNYKNISEKEFADMVVAVTDSILDFFQIYKINIVGSSFGGFWTFHYALQKPDRVEKIVIEGCPAMIEGMSIPKFMKMMATPFMRWLIPKLPTTKSYSKKIMKDIGHTFSINNNRISETFINWYVSLCNNTDTMKNDIAAIGQVLKKGEMNPDFIFYDSKLKNILHRVLILWGYEDTFGGKEIGLRLNSLLKGSSFIGYDNSGHLPWLDQPEQHAKEIRNFLGS